MKHKRLVKQGQKLYKRHKNRLLAIGIPIVLVVLAFSAGAYYQRYTTDHTQPTNIVWTVDNTVRVPDDLRHYLMSLHDCKNYKGTDSPEGVGLWAVSQLERGRYAKLTYGCSWSLSSYIVAIKQDKTWQLLQPTDYFSEQSGEVPNCTSVVQYKIPVQLEGFCINDAGKLTKNPNP